LNVLNKPPIPSLALLKELNAAGQKDGLALESTAAIVMTRFELMWNVFLQERSFDPFMRLYLDRWLHSSVFFPSLRLSADLDVSTQQRPTSSTDHHESSYHCQGRWYHG
jgi:biotin--protein ligase